jgi:ABC-type Na+ efflux pump permease subunit
MKKIFIIAAREFRAIVGTKAFLLSIALMPLFMFGSMFAMEALKNAGKIDEKKVAVIDHSKQFLVAIKMSAANNNDMLEYLVAETPNDEQDDAAGNGAGDAEDESDGPPTLSKGSKYFIEEMDPDSIDDTARLELCDRIRQQDLYAFVEIPANIMDSSAAPEPEVRVYSEDSGLSNFTRWVSQAISERAKALRFQEIGLDPDEVSRAIQGVEVKGLGLLEQAADGTIKPAVEKDEMSAIFLPLIVLMLMFMVIFMSSQPMLESVLEEKSQRIAEVLLGCANPSQLMAGKLLGSVAGSLLVVVIYLGGGYAIAASKGMVDRIPFQIVPWFIVFQVFGVMFFAAIFMAVGASVSQLKEAQSMLLPVWMLLMSPLFIWFYVVQEPNGEMAKWLSLFPPATPTMMVLRMATGATIPTWQPVLGLVLLILATVACVYVAGRIFRVGILWQGKTPKLTEMIRWAATG